MKKLTFYIFLLIANISMANISLPSVFSDNMVLQRNSTTKIWGWASPGEEIKLVASWNPTDTLSTKGNRQAKWELKLKTPEGPGPYTITISGYNTIELKNVLVGEVWLASGQSNMEWSASAGIINGEEAIKNANNPNIRFFDVPRIAAEYPQNDVKSNWVECTPETMKYFSAIAYFFGKKLEESLNVPIGIIGSNWGGTPAEIWIPKDAFEKDEKLTEAASKLVKEEWGPNEPSRAFNGMIHPLVPYTIAGVIWYQGETNTSNPKYYKYVFSSLIKSWREKWDIDFPFYFAQIAPYNYGTNYAGVQIRDAQRRTLDIPNTGMVITSDFCDVEDIHPKNKIPIGLRFANLALKNHYKLNTNLVEGPLFDKVVFENKKAKVYFKNSEGLYFKPEKISLFEIAGEDLIFYPAKATIKNNTIIAYSKKVINPKYIRFAWGNTSISNLFNTANIPASSFTTENY